MKEKKSFVCSSCGAKSPKWSGKCMSCGEWNTVEEVAVKKEKVSSRLIEYKKQNATKLFEVEGKKSDRIVTSINEFNRVMGGGIVKDSLTILTSPPGGGKSTLTLSVANDVANLGLKVLYATGEESESQIKNRADRIIKNINKDIWVVSDTSLNIVLGAINEIKPDLIIIDSIQTFALDEYLPARAGNPTQTMECASELLRIAKDKNSPCAVILIGQMNKNDEIAGIRALEHLVDTVLILQGENDEELRSIVAGKNRFGATGEMGFFSMQENGLISIDNPSQFFITQRDLEDQVSGSALTVIKEGSRPIIAEVESLVSNSFTPYPSRIGEALKREQLNTLISILEQRCGINLFNKNVVIKTTGGIKLKEQSSNLAVLMCIASSVFDTPIKNDYAFISDVGLTGELKKVPYLENRVKELDRMGFKRVFIAKGSIRKIKFDNLEVLEFKTIKEVINFVFKA